MGALDGLRVVDLSRVLAGPLCTQMLGDHGAEVVKVESPDGDETRGWGPPFLESGVSAYYANLNRNKRNVVLDLRTEVGQEALRRLLDGADVLVENFKGGTLARWGLPDDQIAERWPRLVHARISGFGPEGPMAGAPGYDAALQAYGGLMSVNGEPDGPPLRLGVPVVDMVTGMHTFAGILLALHERALSGRGQLVEGTLLDSAIGLLHPHSGSWLADGRIPERTGSAHPAIAPYDTHPCGHGELFLAVGNDRQFAALVGLLGRAELAEDPRFASNAQRVRHRHELREQLVALMASWDGDELGRALIAVGVPSAPVHDVGEALTDPQVLARDMVVRHGDYAGVGVPVKLARTPGSVRSVPAAQGADTAEVLAELGFTDAEVAAIAGAG